MPAKKDPVKAEIARLNRIYKDLPKNQYEVVKGLIVQAARLRVRLDELWKDIQENGETEMFSQSAGAKPYQRERVAARLFAVTDKNYQSVIKQLNDLTPSIKAGSKLEALRDE